MRLKPFLKAVAVILVIVIGVLLYLFWYFNRPNYQKKPYSSDKLRFLFSIYAFGPDDALSTPHGVAADKQGNIYVSDTGNKRILIFNSRGEPVKKFAKDVGFWGPVGISIAEDNGDVYVADRLADNVSIISKNGKLKKKFYMHMPLIPLVKKNKVYITTFGPLFITDRNGKVIQKIGSRGRDLANFDFPNGIAVDKRGNIYVSDTNNLRLQALTKNGEVKWVEGSPPEDVKAANRRFGLPAGLALDEEERLYLVDAFHNSLRVLTKEGEELFQTGEYGSGDGELYYPAGIAYLGNGRIAIADKFNNRINVYRVTI